jgi:hypothetical protein
VDLLVFCYFIWPFELAIADVTFKWTILTVTFFVTCEKFFDIHSLPHTSHLCCVLMLWCSFKWTSSLTPVMNCASHRTQMCGCFMCILWWSRISSMENNSPQNLHICICWPLKPGPQICKTLLSMLLWLLPSLYKSFADLKDKEGSMFIRSNIGMCCYFRLYSNAI